MEKKDRLVVFCLDGRHFGLAPSKVERIIHAVEITPLPSAPGAMLGAINVQGHVVPVVNTRARLGLPHRTIVPSDRIIIAQASSGSIALVVDEVVGFVETDMIDSANSEGPFSTSGCVDRMMKFDEKMVLVCDLDRLVSGNDLHALGLVKA